MRRSRAIATAAVVGLFAFPAPPAFAADPGSQTVNVPTAAGVTRTITWTGTIPAGSNPTSDCDSNPALADIEMLTINAPASYATVSATFTFSIHWTPPGAEEVADEILTVVNTDG